MKISVIFRNFKVTKKLKKTEKNNAIMITEDKIIEIFCLADDFCKLFEESISETVNDELKNIAQVEHSRHRCFENFVVNMLGAIAAYCFFPKKPCIHVNREIDKQLTLF